MQVLRYLGEFGNHVEKMDLRTGKINFQVLVVHIE